MDQINTLVAEDSAVTGFVYGLGPAVLALNAMAFEFARTDIPALILGESGTGKDTYAQLIHRLSQKGSQHFCKINCSSVASGDLLSQLNQVTAMLSSSGASTTIYLDNIQELDIASQLVLLAHLPDGEGSSRRGELTGRLICSTTHNLESELQAGRFRRELYFRLNGASLRLPPLRDRREDIPALAEFFINKHAALLKKKNIPLSSKTVQTLCDYHWPGNIRELENLTRKVVIFNDVQMALNDLQAIRIVNQSSIGYGRGTSLKVAARAASKQAERQLIMQALERTRWNRKRAAQELQISYKSLLYKIKQIGAVNGE